MVSSNLFTNQIINHFRKCDTKSNLRDITKLLKFNYFSSRSESTLTVSRRVVVTGLGSISPLGNNVENSWNKLINGESATSKLDENFKGLPCQVAARIDKTSLNLDSFSKSDIKCMSPATVLAILASNEALNSAKLHPLKDDLKERTGVCVGMGMFDLSDVYKSHQNLCKGYNRVSPYFIPRILPNMACGHISMRFGLQGPNHSVSTACATGAHAIGDAYRFIKYGDADIMLAGSSESCIDPLSIAGFCRIRALTTSFNDDPSKASRPFDTNRDGFVMGEGSAILVLEEYSKAKERGAFIYAEILGYGLSGDAHHMTSPSKDGAGAILAMKRALKEAQIEPNEITYINAHATSTPAGDKIEALAINKIFGEGNILVSSTKGAHGHLLGSSGNLEALFVVKACKEKLLPPSINIEKLDSEINLNIIQKAHKWSSNKRIALKNSFGFGGINACLCIASFEE